MIKSRLLALLLAPFMMFAVEEGAAVVDRGDDLVAPGAPDTSAADAVAVAEEAARIAAEEAAKGGSDDEGGTEEEKKARKDTRIPLERHKQVLERERTAREAVEAELARYKQGARVADVNETLSATEDKLTGMEKEYNQLLADGDIDKATAKMTEIRRMERTVSDQKADMRATEAEARAYERVQYDTTVERLESAYPILNPEHDTYDKDQVAEVLDLQSAYQMKGLTPTQALQKAAKLLLGADTKKQTAAVETTARVDAKDVAKEVAAARKEGAVAKGIAAAKGTPPTSAEVGLDSDKAGGGVLTAEKAMAMSPTEFAKLSEVDLARMRGDIL